jgi:hypothetical protein
MLEAPIDGCSSRRRRMISVNSALRCSAPGNITAATGVANNPFTSTSVPDMPGNLRNAVLRERKRGGNPAQELPTPFVKRQPA